MTVKLAFYNDVDKMQLNAVSAFDSLSNEWGFDGVLWVDLHGEFLSRGEVRAYLDLTSLIADFPTYKFVYLFQKAFLPIGWTSTPLPDFTHPTSDTIYVVGSNIFGLDPSELSTQNGSEIINLETAGVNPDRSLFAYDVALTVLYDRFLKTRLFLG